MQRRHGSLYAWISGNFARGASFSATRDERPRRWLRAGGIVGASTAGLLLLSTFSPIARLNPIHSVLAAYAPPALFSQPQVFAVEASPRYVAVGDVNQDGHPDLVVVNSAGLVQILVGNAAGSFTALGTYAAGVGPTSVAVGDFNGDGHPDLIAANGDSHVSILLGNGDGTFLPLRPIA